MAAPKGNKNAKGHGRPIIYDRVEWGDKIFEWSKQDDALNLNEFCALHDLHADYLCDWANDSDYFCQQYKKAKAKIAARREKKLHENAFNYGAYQRQLGVYDRFTLKHEREEKEFEANLKKMLNDDELRSQLDQFLHKFKEK